MELLMLPRSDVMLAFAGVSPVCVPSMRPSVWHPATGLVNITLLSYTCTLNCCYQVEGWACDKIQAQRRGVAGRSLGTAV